MENRGDEASRGKGREINGVGLVTDRKYFSAEWRDTVSGGSMQRSIG